MTTPHPDPSPADHPDLEHLSALVDGYDEDGTGEHVAGCTDCAAAVAALGDVARAVGGTGVRLDVGDPTAGVHPNPDADADAAATDRAVAAALAATEQPLAPIVPLAGRRRFPRWVLPAAAAVLVVAAAVPLASRLSNGEPKSSTAAKSSATAGTASRNDRAADAAAAPAAGSAVPDLGGIDDAGQLRTAVVAATGTFATTAAPAPDRSASAAGGAATASGSSAAAGQPASPTCSSPASAGGTVQYRAVLVWQGTPASVDVVVRPDGSRVAVVNARADCRVLATVPL